MRPAPASTPAPAPGPADGLVPGLPAHGRAAVKGGVLGNYVDMIAIFLPVFALGPALQTLGGPHVTALAFSLIMAATLIGRPLGAMIFGLVADRLGRTSTTQIAISGTATCTFLVAAVPTHESIGVWAITLVIALRFVGGMFLAGEYTSAIPLAMEWAAPRRRGLVSGLIHSMAPWAQATIALATVGLLLVLGEDAYGVWGWRLSFVVGGCASLALLLYYRRHVADAPEVVRRREAALAEGATTPLGLRAVVTGAYAGAFWQAFGIMTGLWFMTNMVVIVITPRLTDDIGLTAGQATAAMGIACAAQAVVMSVTGHLSTLVGRRRFMVAWGLLAATAGPLLWLAVMDSSTLAPVAIGVALLQMVTVTAYGPMGAYLCERFPAHVRSTGYGTAYSLSIIVPALYPFWLPAVEDVLGRDGAVTAVLMLGGALVAGFAARGPRLAGADLDRPVEELATRAEERTGRSEPVGI